MIINGNYSKKVSINIIAPKQTSPKKIKTDILFTLISIYYYEKALYLNNNKELIFNKNYFYYFINPKWILNFKKLYNYQMLSQYLKSLQINGMPITYYNFEKYISLIKNYLSQKYSILENEEIPENLMLNRMLSEKRIIDNISYYPYCYIIDMRIRKIIQNYFFVDKNLVINSHKVFAKDNYIFLLNQNNNIIIGKLNENFIFISHYIIFLKSSELLSNELFLLTNYSFDNYLKYRKIKNFSYNKLPILDDNFNTIGGILLVQNIHENNENKPQNLTKNSSSNKFIQSQSNEPKNSISTNDFFQNEKNNEFAHYNKNSNLANKDQKIQIKKKIENQTNNIYNDDMKVKKEYYELNQKFEEKEKKFQNLSKEYNILQAKMKELENSYI